LVSHVLRPLCFITTALFKSMLHFTDPDYPPLTNHTSPDDHCLRCIIKTSYRGVFSRLMKHFLPQIFRFGKIFMINNLPHFTANLLAVFIFQPMNVFLFLTYYISSFTNKTRMRHCAASSWTQIAPSTALSYLLPGK